MNQLTSLRLLIGRDPSDQLQSDGETPTFSSRRSANSDRKLAAFKHIVATELKGKKILVFSYFKDTALLTDTDGILLVNIDATAV